MNAHGCGTVLQAFFRLHLKTSAMFSVNLEAELLGAGVHRGRLAHTRRSCNQNGVAQRLPSITLCLSLALEVSTVPHICTPGKLEIFHPKEWNMGIFMKTIIVKLKCCLFRLPKVKKKKHTTAVFLFLFLQCSSLITDGSLFPSLQPTE